MFGPTTPAMSLNVASRFESVMLKNQRQSLFRIELLSRTIHKALTIDPDNCFEHNHFNHSKLRRTTSRSSNEYSQRNDDCAIEKCLQARLPGFSLHGVIHKFITAFYSTVRRSYQGTRSSVFSVLAAQESKEGVLAGHFVIPMF